MLAYAGLKSDITRWAEPTAIYSYTGRLEMNGYCYLPAKVDFGSARDSSGKPTGGA